METLPEQANAEAEEVFPESAVTIPAVEDGDKLDNSDWGQSLGSLKPPNVAVGRPNPDYQLTPAQRREVERLQKLAGKYNKDGKRRAAQRILEIKGKAAVKQTPLNGEFSDLEALLTESLEAEAELKEIEGLRKSLAESDAAGLTPEARKELRQRILLWEVKHEWDVLAWVLAIELQTCGCCGHVKEATLGLFQRQVHRMNLAKRLVSWIPQELPKPNDQTPREVSYYSSTVPACGSCSHFNGFERELDFNWTKGEVIES